VVVTNYYSGVGADTCDASALYSSTAQSAVGEFDSYCDASDYDSTVVIAVSCDVTPADDVNSGGGGGGGGPSVPDVDTLDCDYLSLALSYSDTSNGSTTNITYTTYFPLNVCVAEDVSPTGGHREQYLCDENGDVYYNQYVLSDTDCTGLPLHSTLFTTFINVTVDVDVSININVNCGTGNVCDYAIVRGYENASDCSVEPSTFLESASQSYSEEAHMVGVCEIQTQTDGSNAYSYSTATICDGDAVAKYSFYNGECSGNAYSVIWSATPGDYTECEAPYYMDVLTYASCAETTTTTTTTTTSTTSSTSSDSTTSTTGDGVVGGASEAAVITAAGSIFVTLGMVAYVFFFSL